MFRARFSLLALGALSTFGGSGCTEFCGDIMKCSEPGEGGAGGTTSSASSSSNSSSSSTNAGPGGGGDGGSPTSSSSDGGAGNGGAGGDGGGGNNPGCALVEGAPLGAQCGIFVDASVSSEGDGTQGSPFKTIAAAVADADAGDAIYVCAAASSHDEAVSVSKSLDVVGGLDCATWSYAAAGRTQWTAASDAIPLRATGGGTTLSIAGFTIAAADATTPGGSSIGVLVAEATLDVDRCEVSAGAGAMGIDATQGGTEADAADGFNGAAGCNGGPGVIGGGGGGQSTCQGSNRNGGMGGTGTDDVTFGDDGNPGQPSADGGGPRGVGEGSAGIGAACTNGGPGTPGVSGLAGPGATSGDDGGLSSSGFEPAAGGAGTAPGTPGAGGGGGGGANRCAPGDGGGAGPSGGGGGAGGCGGSVGAPGGGGGASIALVSVEATVTLANTTLFAADGGVGGDGAPGQLGQPGGSGGLSVGVGACSGGNGREGGQGGSGGGGRGGHSLAIAYSGTAPTTDDTVAFELGTPGDGGDGGVGVDAGNVGGAGAPGVQSEMLALPGA